MEDGRLSFPYRKLRTKAPGIGHSLQLRTYRMRVETRIALKQAARIDTNRNPGFLLVQHYFCKSLNCERMAKSHQDALEVSGFSNFNGKVLVFRDVLISARGHMKIKNGIFLTDSIDSLLAHSCW